MKDISESLGKERKQNMGDDRTDVTKGVDRDRETEKGKTEICNERRKQRKKRSETQIYLGGPVAEWVRSLYFSALNHSIISPLCLV